MGLTPEQRKKKVATLREEHEDYFQKEGKINALYIPKMAYRPQGKDELHITFFPSELENNMDIYFLGTVWDDWENSENACYGALTGLTLRPFDEVGDDQEIAWKAHLDNDIQFHIEALTIGRGSGAPGAFGLPPARQS